MATVRLSTDIKREIASALLSRAFDEREAALDAEFTALGVLIYNDTYSREEQELMAKLPADFLDTLEGQRAQFAGEWERVPWGENRRVAHGRGVVNYPARHPFTDTYRDIKKRRTALKDERERARREALCMLSQATTINRLIELWPEVKPFAEKYLKKEKAKSLLPVLRTEVLNQKFKLPVSSSEKTPAKTKKARRK